MSWQREAWSEGPQLIVFVLFILAMLVGGVHLIRTYLLPAEEALRRNVYEESKSYRDGTIRDLDNLRLQWMGTDDEVHRSALEEMAGHRSADFPRDELPDRIREWLDEIER